MRRRAASSRGCGLRGFLVGGELEVGEVVGVEVHVLLLVAAGAGALRPKFLSEARRGARRVEDALLLR
jgi:hypothetical protein